jgi:hypothetical protein
VPAACILSIAVYVTCASFLLPEVAFNFVDIDISHQMNLIRASLAAGHLLTQDPFSYVPTVRPMIQHEWGSGVIAFSQPMDGGSAVSAEVFDRYRNAHSGNAARSKRGARVHTSTFSPVAADLMHLGFLRAVRAQVYSFLFLVLLLWILESSGEGRYRWPLLWLAVFPLWVNLHGGFVAGLCFLGLYVLEQKLIGGSARATVLLLGAMGLEVFINPYGVRYFSYLFRAVTMARPRIPEWTPVWNLGWMTAVLFLCALAVWLYALIDLQSWRTHGILLIPAAAIEAILHFKMLPLFGIVWLCYAPRCFKEPRQEDGSGLRAATSAIPYIRLLVGNRPVPYLSGPTEILAGGSSPGRGGGLLSSRGRQLSCGPSFSRQYHGAISQGGIRFVEVVSQCRSLDRQPV